MLMMLLASNNSIDNWIVVEMYINWYLHYKVCLK